MATLSPPVLLTEDDADSRTAFSLALTGAGYHVVAVSDGQEALNLLDGGLRPRLMIIDLMLPKVTGWELLHYIQEDRELRQIPRVVVTGVPERQVRSIADVVLMKPVSPVVLISKVRGLIGDP